METLLSVLLGIGLSAACGFRIFVPFLVVGLAARTGHLTLGPSFAWMASTPGLIALAVATVLEIAAYYVPWLDHALDLIATPAAVVAGVVMTASVITGLDPMMKWTLALIAGGGIAGTVQALTVGGRKVSLLTTGGLANPAVATAELGGSVLLALLAIALPLVAFAVVAWALFFGVRYLLRLLGPRAPQPPPA
ncbi:MAG TPA: DUF4126 domain-containing protein [Candidatus Polarisedimenticolaceae bacterium]|nr:DUF4126 domain-containing protein [Candidatus Polarisedimenticolaceae bacterium]